MANFVHIGSHIINTTNIAHISKSIDSVNGSKIFIWLHEGHSITAKFDSLPELAATFARLIKDLT